MSSSELTAADLASDKTRQLAKDLPIDLEAIKKLLSERGAKSLSEALKRIESAAADNSAAEGNEESAPICTTPESADSGSMDANGSVGHAGRLRRLLLERLRRLSLLASNRPAPEPELADWAFASIHGSTQSRPAEIAAAAIAPTENPSADDTSTDETPHRSASWSSWLKSDEQEPPPRQWPGLIE